MKRKTRDTTRAFEPIWARFRRPLARPLGHLRHRSGNAPARILEDDLAIVVESDVAGISPEDIDVLLSPKALAIRAGRPDEAGDPPAGPRLVQQSFLLPPGIDLRRVKAELRDSLLRVILPRCA